MVLTFCLSPTMNNETQFKSKWLSSAISQSKYKAQSPFLSPYGPVSEPELMIRKTFPTPDNDTLPARGSVYFEERVWQSNYLQKQLDPDAKPHFWGTRGAIFTRKGFWGWHWSQVCSSSISRPVTSQSPSWPCNFHAGAFFTECMNNYIYCWRVS